MAYSFSLKYLATSITFQSTIPTVIEYISFIFGNLRADPSSRTKMVYTIQKGDEGYSLIHKKKTIFKNFPLDSAIENIEISVDSMVTAENPGILFFHAGAVSDRDGNISLLLSESGGGKTTLCSMLSQRDLYFEGDELVGFSLMKPCIPIPFKKASKLRRETLPFLGKRGRLLGIPGRESNELLYWLPDKKENAFPEDKKSIQRLFLLRFSLSGPNRIFLLRPQEALKALVNACHHFSKKKLMAIDIILSIINHAEVFSIIYNEPQFALSSIREGYASLLHRVKT